MESTRANDLGVRRCLRRKGFPRTTSDACAAYAAEQGQPKGRVLRVRKPEVGGVLSGTAQRYNRPNFLKKHNGSAEHPCTVIPYNDVWGRVAFTANVVVLHGSRPGEAVQDRSQPCAARLFLKPSQR